VKRAADNKRRYAPGTGCGALCAPFAPSGKQAEFLRMEISKKPLFISMGAEKELKAERRISHV